MKSFTFSLLASLLFSFSASADQSPYPLGPDTTLTPGALCTQPDSYRYPEHIPYCNRNVTTDTKNQLFKTYDQVLGYQTTQMNRADFKIDHFIPLCMGGSNDVTNLWPQYKADYTITDPLEALSCEKMSEGLLLQKDAVALIKQGKYNLSQVPAIMAQLNALGDGTTVPSSAATSATSTPEASAESTPAANDTN